MKNRHYKFKHDEDKMSRIRLKCKAFIKEIEHHEKWQQWGDLEQKQALIRLYVFLADKKHHHGFNFPKEYPDLEREVV